MGDLGINRLYIYIYRCSMKSPSFWYINSLSLLSFPYFIIQIMVEFMELEFQCSRYFVCLRSKIYILEKIYHTNIITINMRCFAELTHAQASTKSFPSRIYKNSIVWFVDIYIYILIMPWLLLKHQWHMHESTIVHFMVGQYDNSVLIVHNKSWSNVKCVECHTPYTTHTHGHVTMTRIKHVIQKH